MWITQRSKLASGDRVWQDEGVAAEHVDVIEAERWKLCNIVRQNLGCRGRNARYGFSHVMKARRPDLAATVPLSGNYRLLGGFAYRKSPALYKIHSNLWAKIWLKSGPVRP
jgi:hypothetical protein